MSAIFVFLPSSCKKHDAISVKKENADSAPTGQDVKGDDAEKSHLTGQRLEKVLTALQDINRLATDFTGGTEYPKGISLDKPTEAALHKIVNRMNTPEELGLLAESCWRYHRSNDSTGQCFPYVFDLSFWLCVSRLSDLSDSDAVDALAYLHRDYANDGGASVMMEDAIKHQQERMAKGKVRGAPPYP